MKAVGVPLFEAAMFCLKVELEDWNRKPCRPLLKAVLRVRVSFPGWPLSMNPSTALRNEIEFVTTWLAAGLVVPPPPNLKPFPSPWKLEKPQRLNPLPQTMVSSIVTGEANSLDKESD